MTVTCVKKYILIMYMYYYYFCSYTCINIYLATFNLWLWLNFDVYMMLRTSVSSNLSFSHTCFVFLIKYLASFFFLFSLFFFLPTFSHCLFLYVVSCAGEVQLLLFLIDTHIPKLKQNMHHPRTRQKLLLLLLIIIIIVQNK